LAKPKDKKEKNSSDYFELLLPRVRIRKYVPEIEDQPVWLEEVRMPRQRNLESQLSYRIPRIKLALVKEKAASGKRFAIRTPSDVAEFLGPLQHASEEHFVSVHLNAKNEVIGLHEVSHGTLSSSLVHPREVFKAALIANSYAIVVCHNHPSGSSISPSKEDLDTTRQLLSAGKILGVSVVDHLIVGPTTEGDGCYSVRENHPLLWEGGKPWDSPPLAAQKR
jgi:DNA repair protein RadC